MRSGVGSPERFSVPRMHRIKGRAVRVTPTPGLASAGRACLPTARRLRAVAWRAVAGEAVMTGEGRAAFADGRDVIDGVRGRQHAPRLAPDAER